MSTPLVIGKSVSSSERTLQNRARSEGFSKRIQAQTDPLGLAIGHSARASDVAIITISNTQITTDDLAAIATMPVDRVLYANVPGY
jgi:hypothetical protein